MLVRVPDYFDRFQCLAGACPHSCCTQWEVVLDEESVERYERVEGPLGEKLRAAMTTDEEGDVCFALHGGRCPFLDEENLCEIHRQLGQEATSVTCREHPRFTEDYGAFCEITLAASCPAANDLLLGSREVLTFREFETEDPAEESDGYLETLVLMREQLLSVLTDRSRPLNERLGEFLRFGAALQARLDGEEPEDREAGLPRLPENALGFLRELEALEPDWREVLRQAEEAEAADWDEALGERIAVYVAWRYLLKAVNDGDLLTRTEFVVFALLVVERVAAVCGLAEALRRFSCEIEHSEENLEAVLEALAWGKLCMLMPAND